MHAKSSRIAHITVAFTAGIAMATTAGAQPGPAAWENDLSPIPAEDWNADLAAHLLERAGFGGTPGEIARVAAMAPADAVRSLVYFTEVDNGHLEPFEHSGIHDPGLEPFPATRPALTDMAKETGMGLGIRAKPAGNRRLQPIVNRFFYWLRASQLETNRVSYWWANRMLTTRAPLQEKMALFWHGHFAVSENKIRDYRKSFKQLTVFQEHGTGNFRDLMVAVAQGPAMLSFLDAGVNVAGAPNENFAREIMELFTMGVGHYTEADVREAARAFTGWNYVDLDFVVNEDEHDDGLKTFLGHTGRFDGVDVIDIIMEQPVTAEYIAGKIYRFFVRDEPSAELTADLGALLRDADYELAPLLETILLSKDFYSEASVGAQIRSPVQLVVSTYKKLGLTEIPGVPDFNMTTAALGQSLFRPPTVAGWSEGRSWITPGLLIERGNFVRDVLFPDIAFIAPDRYQPSRTVREVADRIRQGFDIGAATQPAEMMASGAMAESNSVVDRDEDFNTRYGSFRGWQMAIQRVKAIPRETARIDLRKMVLDADIETSTEVVDYLIARFMRVPPGNDVRGTLIDFLTDDLGTDDVRRAESYMEDSLRLVLHLILSAPEYQLN